MVEEETPSLHPLNSKKLYDYRGIAEKVDNLINIRNEIPRDSIETITNTTIEDRTNTTTTETNDIPPPESQKPPNTTETPSLNNQQTSPNTASSLSIENTGMQEILLEDPDSEKLIENRNSSEQPLQLTDVRDGFGWKGLGSRQIHYNEKVDEFIYEINEPILSDSEKELLNHIVYLFGINVNIDVHGVGEHEKSLCLQKALQNIL